MTAVSTAKADDGFWRAIWIERICLSGLAVVVNVPHRHKSGLLNTFFNSCIWEVSASFAMVYPNTEHRSFHVAHPNLGSGTFLDSDCCQSRLKATTLVVNESRLL